MGRPRKDEVNTPVVLPLRPPATTPQARENQLIGYAVDLVERQLLDGTASSQVLSHFLKLATVKEQLERQKLENETLLLKARVNSISAEGDMSKLLDDALNAFKGYQPTPSEEVELD